MDISLQTPYEIIETLVANIEKTRKRKKLRQKDVAQKSGVPLATYQKFIYEKNISLVSLIKIMYLLDMTDNLASLVAYEEFQTLDDIRAIKANRSLPKRIRVKDE